MRQNWRSSLTEFCRLKDILIQFFPVALSVIFLLVYAKCNFASVLMFLIFLFDFRFFSLEVFLTTCSASCFFKHVFVVSQMVRSSASLLCTYFSAALILCFVLLLQLKIS